MLVRISVSSEIGLGDRGLRQGRLMKVKVVDLRHAQMLGCDRDRQLRPRRNFGAVDGQCVAQGQPTRQLHLHHGEIIFDLGLWCVRWSNVVRAETTRSKQERATNNAALESGEDVSATSGCRGRMFGAQQRQSFRASGSRMTSTNALQSIRGDGEKKEHLCGRFGPL